MIDLSRVLLYPEKGPIGILFPSFRFFFKRNGGVGDRRGAALPTVPQELYRSAKKFLL
jgi:hypothetical protein